jgi:D-glycero-D-manno-heptose 1,7-bisphosphate phosphatase
MGIIKAVFVDRDGTINVEKDHLFRVEDFELIPRSLEALKMLSEKGIRIYIVTNQGGIAKGLYTEEQFCSLTTHMLDAFGAAGVAIEKVLYCPHHAEGTIPEYTLDCLCRKPNTKLIEEVMDQERILPGEAILIGDKNSDIDAGNKVGMETYLVLTGYGTEHRRDTKASFVSDDLFHAASDILERYH